MTRPTRHFLIWSIIILLAGWFISSVSAILLPFVLGMLLAYLLDPLVDHMESKAVPRSIATAVVTVFSFAALVILIAATAPLIGEQMVRLMQTLPEQINQFSQPHMAKIRQIIHQLPASQENAIEKALTDVSIVTGEMLGTVISGLFASGGAVLNIFSLLLITPVVTFYLLRDWHKVIQAADDLLPRAHAPVIRQQLTKMDDTISGFLRGQMLVCATLALFYVVLLTLVGLNFSVVIGAAAGFLIIIPYAGWFAAASVGMVVAILQYDSVTMIGLVGAIFLLGQLLESYFLTPSMVGDRVGLHPVWIIFGMLAGGVLLGFVGVLLAIPLAAIIGVLIRFAIERYKCSELYLSEVAPSLIHTKELPR